MGDVDLQRVRDVPRTRFDLGFSVTSGGTISAISALFQSGYACGVWQHTAHEVIYQGITRSSCHFILAKAIPPLGERHLQKLFRYLKSPIVV